MLKARVLLTVTALALTALAGPGTAFAQTANVQIIHNSPDPGAAAVDIYVDNVLAVPGLAFRDATGIVPLDAGERAIGIAPGGSMGPEDILATFSPTLEAGESYVVMAAGVLDVAGLPSNPEGVSTAFNLYIFPGLQTSASMGMVGLLAFHGAPDAPTVDVVAPGVGVVVPELQFTDFKGYVEVPEAKYALNITPAGSPEVVVATFEANLLGLDGGTAVVFASGYLEPNPSKRLDAFGLFAALNDGTVIELPATTQQTADVQIIHNSPDPAAASVDIYLGQDLAVPSFEFRTATGIVPLPAETLILVGVAPGGSSGPQDILATVPFTLAAGESYAVMASGVIDVGGLPSNPEGISTAFELVPFAPLRTSGSSSDVDLLAFHGAPDAPTVDVLAAGVGPLFSDLTFKDFSQDYVAVPPASYTLLITPAGTPGTVVARFKADLSSLGGGAAIVFASGYLSDMGMLDAFGLFAALADGTVLELEPVTVATETASWGDLKSRF